MPPVLFLKLLAIFVTIGIGWAAGRTKAFSGGEAARILSNAAFFVFAPALLFRATARIDFQTLPWRALLAFFVPVVLWMLAVYVWQRRRENGATPARPAVRAITAAFGNNAQLGIPMATALFGETGLQVHLAVVSLHALMLLTILTLLVERDLAHAQAQVSGQRPPLARTLALVVRNTVIHPIVLPVLAGMAWNFTGLPIPGPVDEVLVMLGTAVVPLCLVAIGLSMGHYGLKGAAGAAASLAAGQAAGAAGAGAGRRPAARPAGAGAGGDRDGGRQPDRRQRADVRPALPQPGRRGDRGDRAVDAGLRADRAAVVAAAAVLHGDLIHAPAERFATIAR